MSEVAANDAETVTETPEKLTWGIIIEARKQAAAKIIKAGSREALAQVLASYLPGTLDTHLTPAEYRQQLDNAVADAVDEVRKWEGICSMSRRTKRVGRVLKEIEGGTYRAPRKRRKARKRKVAK